MEMNIPIPEQAPISHLFFLAHITESQRLDGGLIEHRQSAMRVIQRKGEDEEDSGSVVWMVREYPQADSNNGMERAYRAIMTMHWGSMSSEPRAAVVPIIIPRRYAVKIAPQRLKMTKNWLRGESRQTTHQAREVR